MSDSCSKQSWPTFSSSSACAFSRISGLLSRSVSAHSSVPPVVPVPADEKDYAKRDENMLVASNHSRKIIFHAPNLA